MRRRLYMLLALAIFLASCASSGTPQAPTSTQAPGGAVRTPGTSSITGIKLPPGFQISVYARGLNIPRFMTIGPNGTLLVAERGANSVIALPPGSSPTQAGAPIVVASDLNSPTSLVMHDGYLYVGEGSSIARMSLGNDLKAGPIERIITDLPEGGQHSTRTVLIGPDNRIYVSIGSDCNVCADGLSASHLHRTARCLSAMTGPA